VPQCPIASGGLPTRLIRLKPTVGYRDLDTAKYKSLVGYVKFSAHVAVA